MCVIMHSYAAVVELADGICLESRRAARLRGFKSLPLRFLFYILYYGPISFL